MLPAHQRFKPDDLLSTQMHFGLIVHTQFAARDRLPQVGFEAEAFQGARVHLGVEHFILRRAGSLGAIHGTSASRKSSSGLSSANGSS
jgi:hypothetical protein